MHKEKSPGCFYKSVSSDAVPSALMTAQSVYLLLFLLEKTWPGLTLYTAALHSASPPSVLRSVSRLKYTTGTHYTLHTTQCITIS